jgi:hypothetical protein
MKWLVKVTVTDRENERFVTITEIEFIKENYEDLALDDQVS